MLKKKHQEIKERCVQRRLDLKRDEKEKREIEKILRDVKNRISEQEKKKLKKQEKILAKKRKKEEAEQSLIQFEQKDAEAERLKDEKKFDNIRIKLKKEAAEKEKKGQQRLLNKKQLDALGIRVASLKMNVKIDAEN
ncbi:uncharacterized protein MONOS_4661 [Monocercomonoides exilis]|uniref:uncharacterized protein n=1 Tax=Monocercomonoides exilis TaxID=2049356 RepID=UPI00355AAEE5|nr:hypothetical protein MONOS_4661 [Monocercomonoides exilis]|eukprot:MONOS_4661.1-p1 / transcript=MONOS_4661.1 / gene=MONOS_4661 / organism=Monocercomonoides_exilis_PA203 / gene_product=unspecified product / transcript_product=unspecified product / location=Mono_scaffold00126:64003-64413(+) / protein_length=137 / sequence_SO=supercontig / SO=protein_coding / is_pseudo=false